MAMRIIAERCTGCGVCLPACPNDGIDELDGSFQIRSGYCTECYGVYTTPACSDACPVEAVELDPDLPDDDLTLASLASELTPDRFPRD